MKWDYFKVSAVIFLLTNALFFLGGFNTLTKISTHSTVLAIILGSVFAFFVLSFVFRILKNKTIDIDELSPIISFILVILLVLELGFSLSRITGFITFNVVYSVSFYLIVPLFLIIVVFSCIQGLGTIVRSAFIYLVVIILLSVIMFLTLFSKIDVSNMLPLIDTSFSNILKSSLLYMIIALVPYFYLSLFSVNLNYEFVKILKKGFLYTHGFILLYILLIISILGIPLINLYTYPEVAIFKKISFLNIIDRMETIFSLGYFLAIFIYFALSMYMIFKLLKNIVPIKKRGLSLFLIAFFIFGVNQFYIVSVPVWFFILALSFLLFSLTIKT